MRSIEVKMKVACPQRLLARGRAVFASFIAGSKPTSLYYKVRVFRGSVAELEDRDKRLMQLM